MKRTRIKPRSSKYWRKSSEYRLAVIEAYKPYQAGAGIQCSKCQRIFQPEYISPSHIFSVGSCYQLRMHWKNLLPDCWRCHNAYDNDTTEGKKKTIDRIIKGRWEELIKLRRELGEYDTEIKE